MKRWVAGWVLVGAAAATGCGTSAPGGVGQTDGEAETEDSGSTGDLSSTTSTSASTTSASGSTTNASATGTTTSVTSAGDSTTSGGDTEGSSSGGEPVACPDEAVAPGDYYDLELEFGGLMRTYSMFVPSGYDGASAIPLVFNFHGFTSNAGQQSFFSDFNTDAEERGVIVVYPNGIMNSWNAGACCGTAAASGIDDVGFVRALLDEVAETLCIDRDRVYATGMSNGGFLSHRLACEAADILAAVGPVAGPLGIPPEDCQPSRPVPVIHFHGTGDVVVPYGGSALGFPPVEESLQGWADRNGCDPQSSISFEMNDASCQTWDGCDADASVTLCTLAGAGHCWPGNAFCPSGFSSTTISANAMMLDMFEQVTLP